MYMVIEAKGRGGIQVNLHNCRNGTISLKSETRPPENWKTVVNCLELHQIIYSIISDKN